jgi:hypothetical protein
VNLWTIIAKVIGLIPSAAEAGRAIAQSFDTPRKVNPMDSTLWHSARYGGGLVSCDTCGRFIERQNELCPEAVRRRQALY